MHSAKKYFEYLYGLERSGMKYSLSNIRKLLEHLGNPHKGMNFIHIAGTNGKGATASFIASIFQENKIKTGLYTSPHLFNFNERIRINGDPIDNKYVFAFINEHRKFIDKIKPSFFEVTTAIALKYFRDNNVEAAVLEAGLGGRLDSTNIVQPKLSVITQIALDHMQYLGNTLEAIAKEKLGIVKKDVDVIISDNNKKLKPLFKKSIEKSHLFYLNDTTKIKITGKSIFEITLVLNSKKHKYKLFTYLLGSYQRINAACAVAAVLKYSKQEGIKIRWRSIADGVKKVKCNTGYFGRLEVIKSHWKKYIFDISHNPAGIKDALDNIPLKPDIIVFGMMADKDYKNSIKEILRETNNIIFTKPNYPRALNTEVMYEYALSLAGNKNIYKVNNLRDAVMQVECMGKGRKVILYIGSFFLISQAHRLMKKYGYI